MTTRDVYFRTAAIGIIAAITYLLLLAWIAPAVSPVLLDWLRRLGLGPTAAVFTEIAIFMALPITVLAGGIHLYYSRRYRTSADDPETRCRHCRHILRGLTEPRCPECGERI